MFEYQTAISELTGLPVSNATLYEAPSAVASAGWLALPAEPPRPLPRVARPAPAQPRGARDHQRRLGHDDRRDPARRRRDRRAGADADALGDDVSAVFLQYPNFLGAVEDLEALVPGRQGGRRDRRRPVRPDRARHPAPAGRLRRRHRRGGGPAARQPARLRRAELRLLRRAAGVPAPDAGPDRRRDDRRRRPPRLRAHAADARAAHPPREGDAQHHDRADAQRARRRDLPELARPRRGWSSSASCCSSAPRTRARRWPRSRASSRCTRSRSCASSPSRSTPTSTP